MHRIAPLLALALVACDGEKDGSSSDDTDGPPLTEEVCDGVDNDGDGLVDDEDDDVDGNTLVWVDNDGDGYGAGDRLDVCRVRPEHVLNGQDCDDTNRDINPEAEEVCDGVDNDCASASEEDVAIDRTTFWVDADQDGFGDPAAPVERCAVAVGFSNVDTDCDDTREAVFPGAPELCDTVDNDCDPATPLDVGAIDAPTRYADNDGDTWGNGAIPIVACPGIPGTSGRTGDCDDDDLLIRPGVPEDCDHIDDDCNPATGGSGAAWIPSGWPGVPAEDLTAVFAAGTALAPVAWTSPGPGILALCSDTFASLTFTFDGGVVGSTTPGPTVTSPGERGLQVSGGRVSVTSLAFTGGPLQGGGGLSADGGGALELTDVVIHDTQHDRGGGVWIDGGTLTATRTEIYNAAAEFGGAIGLTGTAGPALRLDDCDLHDNTAGDGGAIWLRTTRASTGVIAQSRIYSNTGVDAAGALVHGEGGATVTLTCEGAPGVDAGFYGHTGGPAVLLVGNGAFNGTDCDMGDPAGLPENADGDVRFYPDPTYTLGDDATFTCANGTCTP